MDPPWPGLGAKPRPKPAPSSVSLKSDRSNDCPPEFSEASPENQSTYNTDLNGPCSRIKPRPKPAPSSASLKSDRSNDCPPEFGDAPPEGQSTFNMDQLGSGSRTRLRPKPVPSFVSVKSDRSNDCPPEFREAPSKDQSTFNMDSLRPGPTSRPRPNPAVSFVSQKSDRSNDCPPEFRETPPEDQGEPDSKEQLDTIFMRLEGDVLTFVKEQLQRFHRLLVAEYSSESISESCSECEEDQHSSDAVLNITLDFLRRMKQEHLAECLSSRSSVGVGRDKLKKRLQQRYSSVFEGVAKAGNSVPLREIYTELHIIEGGATEINQEHEVRYIEAMSRKRDALEATIKCEDLFKDPALRQQPMRAEIMEQEPIGGEITNIKQKMRTDLTKQNNSERIDQTKAPNRAKLTEERPIRTVLTKGVAGIGKTVLTQKFSLDWAEGKANQDIQLLFPFTFRELNVLKDRSFSLVELLYHCFSEDKRLHNFEDLQVLFIFDGLDECRLPLNFRGTRVLTEPTESASLEELLVNLIRGSLLPHSHIWITTRPAAANQIPAEYVSMVTEVQGFTEPQKEQYFIKRFSNKQEANKIISHIKRIRSLYIMCYIPIFCWILSTVLLHLMATKDTENLPTTLTQMYIYFLVVQAKVKNIKYHGGSGTDPHWTRETKKMVRSLGKLAFEQLHKGNLIFYENDLKECGLDAAEIARYSGVFTEIFREESGLYQGKVYCFIHLTVQEFLAAFHIHEKSFSSFKDLLPPPNSDTWGPTTSILDLSEISKGFYRTTVDWVLQSPNGHLDLVLRFLLGLSLPANQKLLTGLLTETNINRVNPDTVKYIHEKLNEEALSTERSLNLLHCLNELNDHTLVEQIQGYMREGRVSCLKSHAQWSALSFILLSSNSDLEEFDLGKYQASNTALKRLLLVVKESTKANLSSCHLISHSCGSLASVISSSNLTHLDLSHNEIKDIGVGWLCDGLRSAPCRLYSLCLSSCGLTTGSCDFLASVLSSSSLTHLDLSNNDLQDSGVEILCEGLKSAPYRLQTLRLSGCLISELGGACMASALDSASFVLEKLDLSFNHLGPSAVLLTTLQKSHNAMKSLRLYPSGQQWMVPGLRKYSCEFSLDPNTVRGNLRLSKTVISGRYLSCTFENTDSSIDYGQVLSSTGLSGRCYWEVKWNRNLGSGIDIAVSYKDKHSGQGKKSGFGDSDQSWSLRIKQHKYSVFHNTETVLCINDDNLPQRTFSPSPSKSHMSDSNPRIMSGVVGVFLDTEAGILSFYEVCLDGKLSHIHTFCSSFTEPLFPGFRLWHNDSSVAVVDLKRKCRNMLTTV